MTTGPCSCCGQQYGGPLLDVGFRTSNLAFAMPAEEHERRVVLTSDTCEFDGQGFYLRGLLPLALRGRPGERFAWGCWITLREADSRRTVAVWLTPTLSGEPPPYGLLANEPGAYARPTLNLDARILPANVRDRPLIAVKPGDHPRFVEQRAGIDMAQVQQIAEQFQHRPGPGR
jgi:hypothetical protein